MDVIHDAANQTHSSEDITKRLVHVNFVKFVEVHPDGQELSETPAIGYIAYNADCQEFGQWSFARSDDYTLQKDVLDRLQERHPRLAQSAAATGGFYLSGQWCGISPQH